MKFESRMEFKCLVYHLYSFDANYIFFSILKEFSKIMCFRGGKKTSFIILCSIISWFPSSPSFLLYCTFYLILSGHQRTQDQFLNNRDGFHSVSIRFPESSDTHGHQLLLPLVSTHFLVMSSYSSGTLLWRCLTRGSRAAWQEAIMFQDLI